MLISTSWNGLTNGHSRTSDCELLLLSITHSGSVGMDGVEEYGSLRAGHYRASNEEARLNLSVFLLVILIKNITAFAVFRHL